MYLSLLLAGAPPAIWVHGMTMQMEKEHSPELQIGAEVSDVVNGPILPLPDSGEKLFCLSLHYLQNICDNGVYSKHPPPSLPQSCLSCVNLGTLSDIGSSEVILSACDPSTKGWPESSSPWLEHFRTALRPDTPHTPHPTPQALFATQP